MKKFDMKKIMKRAWELVKKLGRTMSEGLKAAWAEAKKEVEKPVFSGEEIIDGFKFVLWEKYGKRRIYVNNYSGRNRRNANGYINLETGEIVATGCVEGAAKAFMQKYEIA